MKKIKKVNALSVIALQVILTAISSVIPYGYKTIVDNYADTGAADDYRMLLLIICTGIVSYTLNI